MLLPALSALPVPCRTGYGKRVPRGPVQGAQAQMGEESEEGELLNRPKIGYGESRSGFRWGAIGVPLGLGWGAIFVSWVLSCFWGVFWSDFISFLSEKSTPNH